MLSVLTGFEVRVYINWSAGLHRRSHIHCLKIHFVIIKEPIKEVTG